MILLDTDHLTVLRFRAGERCRRLVARLETAGADIIGTTIDRESPRFRAYSWPAFRQLVG
jgi:hypothetical protein